MENTSHQTVSEQLLLPASEAAQLLGISKRHLHTLNVSGRLPRPIRLGRSVRWNANELRAWIAAGCPELIPWEESLRH